MTHVGDGQPMNTRGRRRALVAKHCPDQLTAYDSASRAVRGAMDRCCELMEESERLGPWSLDKAAALGTRGGGQDV